MLDGMQARTRGKHPTCKDAFDFALKRNLVNFHKCIRIGRLGRRPRVTRARGDLQRAKLHGFSNRRVESDGPPGDLIETGENSAAVLDFLRGRFGDDGVFLRRGVSRLGRGR